MKKEIKKRAVALILIMTCMVALCGGCNKSEDKKELNLYTWDGMFPQEVLDGFEDETGVKIYYSNFDYDEDMLAKLEETKGEDYDLVIADDYIIELAIKEGLVQKLDKTKISNFGNINSLYQGQFYDETNEYTVPYGAGIPLIVYDPAVVGFEITSYEDLWNESLKDSVAIIGNYRVVDGIALKTMGESFNTEDLDVIRAAGEKLKELAPNIRVINDNNTQDFIISGEVSAAFLYTSQVNLALQARPDLKVAYPKEGLGFGIMAAFVPSKAPNADAAHQFLEYILRPEVSAKCFEFLGYYCTNKAAEEFISDDLKDVLVVPESVTEGEIVQNISEEAEQLHSEIWNAFKSECD
ncbi:MAG: spermidine/putrescine ABC transporter substrate-binding protein [Lachnospiraceae bacterium]|nr:spermidine/putrescine ABC transporter substrate-binding protein [Lachnospiraceae bacterium]